MSFPLLLIFQDQLITHVNMVPAPDSDRSAPLASSAPDHALDLPAHGRLVLLPPRAVTGRGRVQRVEQDPMEVEAAGDAGREARRVQVRVLVGHGHQARVQRADRVEETESPSGQG
jgi:hypothetical protein